jgi:hypothetical protein
MKSNQNGVRVVLATIAGMVLLAGCATHSRVSSDRVDRRGNACVDLTRWHADTHPAWRSGSDMNLANPSLMPEQVLEGSIINEGAGAGAVILP